ncbi:hypothetical protein JKP88DRAFT_268216 [Tribonema minus]|uniref:Uncharacterized protein n=1 Tax=Tribonema minus TaxID=303371 RepID=A0A835Z2S5_9STRA|nr:hypothetical protein JKP88DRAFT_268216 [Tribonema minus]
MPGVAFEARGCEVDIVVNAPVALADADVDRLLQARRACIMKWRAIEALMHGRELGSAALAAAAANLAREHATPGVAFEARGCAVRAVVDAEVTLTTDDVDRMRRALSAYSNRAVPLQQHSAAALMRGRELSSAALAAAAAVDLTRNYATPGIVFEARESTMRAVVDAEVTLTTDDVDRMRRALIAYPGRAVRLPPRSAASAGAASLSGVAGERQRAAPRSKKSKWAHGARVRTGLARDFDFLRDYVMTDQRSHPDMLLTLTSVPSLSRPSARHSLLTATPRVTPPGRCSCCPRARPRGRRHAAACCHCTARCHLHPQLLTATRGLLLPARPPARKVQLTPAGAPAGTPPEVWQEFILEMPSQTQGELSKR